uniref:transglutaminase family protein n=1 Tax=Stella sp. TaxID=2912054 RepID=UPI0035B4623D
KWYPGESLPRWAFALYWRGDGRPLWRDPGRVARETADHDATAEDAGLLARAVARRLDLHPDHAMPAFEDPWHYLAREQALPANVDPFESRLDDPEERARLVRVFDRGLGNPVGFVLPVQRWNAPDRRRWRSERWSLRRGRVLLMPGDSPVGFRLPIASLPWIPPALYPHVVPRDPMEALPPLPDPDAARQPYLTGAARGPDWQARVARIEQEAPVEGASVRTALTIEPRDGRLCVFMPPTETIEDYLDLVAAIEDAAAEVGCALHVEGYPPPYDPRLNVIKVTPDPGVIEVNIHPARSWREQVEVTEALYEEARQSRLGTEKFLVDGRHSGTGGGNHIVLGGATPADSPFLRRPDLLRSLVAFWQNHPALSYLFSGLFIGPTSQAPRVDEARQDSLYELEIAFAQVPEPGAEPLPLWLVDRIFRNLLIDVSGNTHRAEICIDKLYSPDGPTGRLGLVEFRAFEMPPHPEMSLAQALLLRALVAWFWREPYRNPPVRWGTALHDRFMLPHFIWADMVDVTAALAEAGFPVDPEWFRPHWTFRFPLLGAVDPEGMRIELRQALEPWHVMGEEGAAGGTVRYVDSTVERLEVKVSGITPDRHRLLVNGRPAPLTPTGRRGEAVAGVRFRAWQAPHSLHPTVPTHGPLVVELWDAWRRRAIGGCTYHVAHPGGRNYTTVPVNAYEAEGRRLARFDPFGLTGGRFDPGPPDLHPDFPLTLDLRRFH